MPKVLFVDFNASLVQKVAALGIEAVCDDYFRKAYRVPRFVLMTASNPMWTFGGGIDAAFQRHFPELVRYKQIKAGPVERIGPICFTITVDVNLTATAKTIEDALRFAIDNTHEGETLIVNGVGTGIGGLSEEVFCEVLKKVLTPAV